MKTPHRHIPRLLLPALALTMTTGLTAPALALAPAGPAAGPTDGNSHAPVRVSTAFTLPGDEAYPEGIATDPRNGDVYVGSYRTGAVYRSAHGTAPARTVLPAGADGRHTANGLKVDAAGRLWVLDSTRGVSVYSPGGRRLLAQLEVPDIEDTGTFVNDLAIGPDGTAYLTDSLRAQVYRVGPRELAAASQGRNRTLEVGYDLSGIPHSGPAGFTLNGIVADRAGRHLLAVDMPAGTLWRITIATGEVREVRLTGGDMKAGDGLELRGHTLWVAHNSSNSLSRWRLSPQLLDARQEERFSDPSLQVPTTLVHHHGRLLVVRSQFDKGGPAGPGVPEVPFTVARVDGI